ncbi:hypothetical protein DEFDS_P076 (plasmid) [Deferribacter desulfuricans SSM1]|uniref:Uncharacterized protein n=1 Tax=Deferribacter desulfuricans (strain DSM 14783 / JCM 11476 / NBRC 101012 / SSM1) TaxID=639282 RepID=D3PEQ8_DEFDS|nr:hypothetical protein [Deferribacter desulfuricans]BAI81700.1 hypothetical protein DEFDS_P076 [Deferribacter desulfuricans SSM1]
MSHVPEKNNVKMDYPLLFSAAEFLIGLTGAFGAIFVIMSLIPAIRYGLNFYALLSAILSLLGIILGMGIGFAFMRMVAASIDTRNYLYDIYLELKNLDKKTETKQE